MHLKKIILNGFKSFADKVVLTFDDGITGIVGPNGSGKSNVIDAVRWVMGEQSAKNLRGEVATDIIFAGSEKRKPLGMAEVSLVFDNSDETGFCPPEYRHELEIALTRRIYADGQREYLINRKPCRLKDIVQFFTATGLGGKSYSMIQQGQVERILNAKPEELREILEEAAGTLSFKKRREEAEKKLEDTQTYLSRVEDIVTELDSQSETLLKQVEKAKKYKVIAEELKQKETSLLAHNFLHFSTELGLIQEGISDKVNREAELAAEISTLDVKQLEVQAELDEANPDLQNLQERLSLLKQDIARAETTILNSDDRIKTAEARLHDYEREIEDDIETQQTLENQVELAGDELSSAKDAAAEIQEQIDNFQFEVDSVDESAQVFDNKIEEAKEEIRSLELLLESNTVRVESLLKDQERIHTEKNQQAEKISTAEEDVSAARKELEAAQLAANSVQSGLDVEIGKKMELEESIQKRDSELTELSVTRDDVKEKYFDCRARYTSLQEVIANASNVGSAIQKINERDPDSESYLHGLLSDYINFNDEEGLSDAAKNAVEKWSERIVLKDLDGFNSLVRASNSQELGALPVTILSLSKNVDLSACEKWAENYDAEPLSRYIKVTSEIEGIENLLARLYHLPAIMLSNDEIQNIPEGAIVITAQGVTVTGKDGLAVNTKSGLGIISRQAELESLAIELKDLERSLAKTQSSLDQLMAFQQEDKAELSDIDKKLNDQNKGSMEVMTNLQSAKQTVDYKLESLENAKTRLEELRNMELSNTKEIEELGKNRISLGGELENCKEELDRIKEDASSLTDQRDEVMQVHQNRKVELATANARLEGLERAFLQQKAQLETVQTKLSRRYEEIEVLKEGVEKAKFDKIDCTERIEDYIREREEVQEELAVKNEANAELIDSVRSIDRELKEKRTELSEIQNFVNDKKLAIERSKIALENIVSAAEERYHLDLSKHEFEPDPNFNAESTGKEVTKLRNRVENFGDINMLAIEEYDSLCERKLFITGQRDEVERSIDLLKVAIEEIEATSRSKFFEIYETINAMFQKLFPILFPGGEAYLALTDDNNLLDAGIEIFVRLPGKKQQKMKMFSGGEKALTAISLVFALLKTKPTPFCFLDEVDAPLDEANVGRYNNLLESLAEQFQFIIITHNRRTMEVLDTLYGVTMQEPGVSKVVGVDLNKDIPDHLKKAFKEQKASEGQAAAAH